MTMTTALLFIDAKERIVFDFIKNNRSMEDIDGLSDFPQIKWPSLKNTGRPN